MTDKQRQPTYRRLLVNEREQVHVIAAHLEIHGPFHMALDPEHAQQLAAALRRSAEIADLSAMAYNNAIERLEEVEHSLALADAAWARLEIFAKAIAIAFVVGAIAVMLCQFR